MRISDLSSDVCPSDLAGRPHKRASAASQAGRAYRSWQNPGARDAAEMRGARLGGAAEGLEIDPHQSEMFRIAAGPLEIVEERPIDVAMHRSEEHTSELQSLMRNSYAVFCLKKKRTQ